MFRIKQLIKMLLQNILLPLLYKCYARRPVETGLVLFADAHHSEMPFSMSRMYEAVRTLEDFSLHKDGQSDAGGLCRSSNEQSDARQLCGSSNGQSDARQLCRSSNGQPDHFAVGQDEEKSRNMPDIHVETFITDFDRLSFFAMAKYLVLFMRRYAVAEYVFICDYFLPVSSCRKRPETKVTQLWHACGMLKKIAYEAKDDIPKGYHGNMFGNYTYMTVSADACIAPHERAMRLAPGRTFATGISRTDFYFDEAWNAKCREHFYAQHPEAQGRKIILWAPTFRGNAAHPSLTGLDEVQRAASRREKEAYLIIKAHPHIDRHAKVSNCEIPTEELLPVADLLITDYSSIMFDWLLYRKPMILYTPDLPEYEAARGFFMDFRSIPFPIVQTEEELVRAMEEMDIRAETYTNGAHDARLVKDGRAALRDGSEKIRTDSQTEKKKEDMPVRNWMDAHAAEISQFANTCVGACDGHATERILQLVGLGLEADNR